MNDVYIDNWKSPWGDLKLAATEKHLVMCDWLYRKRRLAVDQRVLSPYQNVMEMSNQIIQQTIAELKEYAERSRKHFTLPIHFTGSEFQKQVWLELLKIPYGQTVSYLQLSKRLDHPEAIRAVASANGANAIAIMVPCHRILGHQGDLVGYAGGLNAKKKLLELESNYEQLSLF